MAFLCGINRSSLPGPVSGLLFLAVFATAVACAIYSYLIREWGSVNAAAVHYAVPAAVILLDFLFYANKPSASELLGALAVLAGVLMLRNTGESTTSRVVKEWLRAQTPSWRRLGYACRQLFL